MDSREKKGGWVADLLAIPVLATALLSADLALVLPHSEPRHWLTVCGYLALSAALFAGFVLLLGLGSRLVNYVLTRLPLPLGWTRGFVAGLLGLFPTIHLARLITEGDAISASPFFWPLFLLTVLAVVATGVLLAVLGPIALGWSMPGRLLLAATAMFGGAVAAGVTSYLPIMYMRPHRGILLFAIVLLWPATALAISVLLPLISRRVAVYSGVLVAVLVGASAGAGLVLIAAVPQAKPIALYHIFHNSLVAQKIQPILVTLSPPELEAHRSAKEFDLLTDPPVPPLRPGDYRGSNVVLITSDALRGDTVGYISGNKTVSPNIDRIANESTVFTDAIANYSHTARSIRVFLAGSWEVAYGQDGKRVTKPEHRDAVGRLTRVFHKGGYYNMALMMGVAWGESFFRKKRFSGFDVHDQPGPDCNDIADALEEHLPEVPADKPLFAWIYFFDTHTPLRFDKSDQLFADHANPDYLAALHHVDGCFLRVINALKHNNRWNNTILAFSSDHGEALGEHRRRQKHGTCYYHDLHIPFFIRLPNGSSRNDVSYRLQNADYLPTVANLVGLDLSNEALTGRDMSGLLIPGAMPPNAPVGWALSEGHPKQYPCASLLFENWHLIYLKHGMQYSLYDLSKDREETQNLIGERGDIAAKLRPIVQQHWDRVRK